MKPVSKFDRAEVVSLECHRNRWCSILVCDQPKPKRFKIKKKSRFKRR